MSELLQDIYDDILDWCRGRFWLVRLLLLIFFAYLLIRHLGNAEYNSIFGGLNLGIHELGHIVFMPFGEFIMIAGGTILQCLVPIISIGIFYNQRDYFAIAVSFGWLSTNLFSVATYLGDARNMALPLVTPFGGEEIIHDWNYLLGKLGLLKFDGTIAFLVRVGAVICMLICLIYGGWIIMQMMKSPNKRSIEEDIAKTPSFSSDKNQFE